MPVAVVVAFRTELLLAQVVQVVAATVDKTLPEALEAPIPVVVAVVAEVVPVLVAQVDQA
jgi:hypothetical protein